MTMTWRARDDRGHYLPAGEIPYSLEPEVWDDTCRHKPAPTELGPSAEDFGHQPVSNDVDYWGETNDDPPVCARCKVTIRALTPVIVDVDRYGRRITEEQWVSYEEAVPWPCTSAIVLGLATPSA
jgi:hypothetical protein